MSENRNFVPTGLAEEERIMSERASVPEDALRGVLRRPIGALTLPPPPMMPMSATVGAAVSRMKKEHFGAILVVDDQGRLAGVFTERDVVTRCAGGPMGRPLRDVMSPSPETLDPDASLAFALNLMSVGGYRHVPIVARDARVPVALLSMRDVVHELCSHFPEQVFNLPPRPHLLEPEKREGG